ncbi:SPASM domain-containing protein [Pyrococcus sp. NA2]|uniref:SPASM domain-containing protein n=1 Tax=Pyrococcus sp. (strain NA2) TaxID=342949 RepID=UPI0011D1A226|nr:SPASM domain-containing protein [Pyrococcus sp. NA2]
MTAVEEAKPLVTTNLNVRESPKISTISKPPWVSTFHKGKLERIILLIGEGKGRFSERSGIPRSIGCLGNHRLTLYRRKLSLSSFKKVIREFQRIAPGGEVYITNYDDIKEAVELASFASERDLDVYLIALPEDVPQVPKDRKFKLVGEYFYEELDDGVKNVDILLLVVKFKEYKELLKNGIDFNGDIWIDVLYPGSLRFLDFNPIELRKIANSTAISYSPCLAGLVAISPEGFVTPCPLLRKFIVGDITRESLKTIIKKQRLKKFWKLTKDKIEFCSRCNLRYACHDCRALEYMATGELLGMEFCPLMEPI